MTGYIDKNTPISVYQPSKEVADFTKCVRDDYAIGEEILNKTYIELNDRSIIDDENRGQMMFNAFVDTSVEDPNEAWKWRGTRSMARNKGISMHAQLTAQYLLPLFTAQNDNDEEDRDFSEVMRDIVEWMCSPTVSNYQSSFIQIVFAMETNPVTYLGAEYIEVFQTIKEKQQDGKYTTKEILDEVLSGFNVPIYSSNQVLITNAYERNIQKQRRIIKRRWCDKSELEAKYGSHPNWGLVQCGIKSVYDEGTELFYDVKDDSEQSNLVAEEIAFCRRDDSEVPFVNGIYMGDDDVDYNPIKHRDNRDAPKYNITPFGYSRIGEHFFFYKSMMNALGWDNMLYDAQQEVFMNRSLLEAEMPIAISGTDKVDSEVMFPNSVVTLEDPNAKVSSLLPPSNLSGLVNAIGATEKSMNDGSLNETLSGQVPPGSPTAFSIAQAQVAAKKNITAVAKSLAESVTQFGDLMKDIVVNHITVPTVEELLGGELKMKYKSFVVQKKASSGKASNKRIILDKSLIGMDMTDSEKESRALKLLEDSGYPEEENTLKLVNPELISRFKYLTRTDTEEMFAKNAEYWQPVLLNLKTALALDQTIDQEALSRRLMYAYFQSEGDTLVKKPAPAPQPAQGAGPNQFGQMAQNQMLQGATTNAVAA